MEVRGTSRWNMNKLYEQARSKTKTSILFLGLTPYSNYTAFLKFNNSVGFSTDHQRISFTTEQSGDGKVKTVFARPVQNSFANLQTITLDCRV